MHFMVPVTGRFVQCTMQYTLGYGLQCDAYGQCHLACCREDLRQ